MPELPEVEVVRRGLADHILGKTIRSAVFSGHRVARTHPGGASALSAELVGTQFLEAQRRGKYLWLPLSNGRALSIHLRMSGQLLVVAPEVPIPRHTHAILRLSGDTELRFVDQRTFGLMTTDELVADPHAPSAQETRYLPASIQHIAPDPFETAWNCAAVARRIRARDVELKRQLLDQTVVSGIGNIYADEALWQAQLHGRRRGSSLRQRDAVSVLEAARAVMSQALAAGGTSFDALYVNVNGASGYFSRSLHAYGRAGKPCDRCGTPLIREVFTNRSSYLCPTCQRAPRTRRG